MKQPRAALLAFLFPVLLTVACTSENSTVAPTPATSAAAPERSSVSSTAPRAASPTNGTTIPFASQPVRLVVTNAVSTAPAGVTYKFQVATDEAFSSIVYARDGVAPGTDGQTALTIDLLAGATKYYWRALIVAAGENGPVGPTAVFTVGPQVVIQAPALATPAAGDTVSDTPTLTVAAAQRTGPAGDLFYRFEIADTAGFTSIVYSAVVQERTGATSVSHTVARQLEEKTYYWRVFASSPSAEATGPYSATGSFKVTRGMDLRTATIVIGPANIADWKEAGRITSAYFNPSSEELCIFHNRLGLWPAALFADDGTQVEGNQWVFANINGKWYGGAADWYKPGQACKGLNAESIGRDAFYRTPDSPAYSWQPRSGEIFAVMSSTPARSWPSYKTWDERTDVVLIRWP